MELEIKLLIQENNKLQDLISHSVHWWLNHQRPVMVGLRCQARCNHHPLKTVQPLQSQPPSWQWRWKQSPLPSTGLPQGVTNHTCHHPHRFNELATKNEKWNGKPRLECVNGWHSPLKTPVSVLPRTCQSEGKWPQKYTGWQNNPHNKIWSQRYHTIDHLEERDVERGSTRWEGAIINRWTLQLFQTRIKGNVGKTSEGLGGPYIWAFSNT